MARRSSAGVCVHHPWPVGTSVYLLFNTTEAPKLAVFIIIVTIIVVIIIMMVNVDAPSGALPLDEPSLFFAIWSLILFEMSLNLPLELVSPASKVERAVF